MYKKVMQNRRDAERYRLLKSRLLSGRGLELSKGLVAVVDIVGSSQHASTSEDELEAAIDNLIKEKRDSR